MKTAPRVWQVCLGALGMLVSVNARHGIALSGGHPAQAHALRDHGIFSELDRELVLALPARLEHPPPRLTLDRPHGVLLVLDGDQPVNAYPVALPSAGGSTLRALLSALPARDAQWLRSRLDETTAVLDVGDPAAPRLRDSDRDGIPDRLDVLLGARKLAANAAVYTEGYRVIGYPGGDVPRAIGVCTDTVVRALRNAGLDLQKLVAEDIRRAPRAYPMVRRPDANIDHRRVKTIVRWFERHVPALPPGAPLRPGDIVFFDTFAARPGPDHVGIVSDRLAPSGLPLVINNWTVGSVEKDMDLLSWVPVTHRFRLP